MRRHKAFAKSVLFVLLAACSGALPEPDSTPRSVERVFVASRAPLGERHEPSRVRDVTYESVDVSIPSSHRLGQIEWPGSPFAREPFTVSNHVVFRNRAAFNAAITRDHSAPDTLVFVHGYNTSTTKARSGESETNSTKSCERPPMHRTVCTVSKLRGRGICLGRFFVNPLDMNNHLLNIHLHSNNCLYY